MNPKLIFPIQTPKKNPKFKIQHPKFASPPPHEEILLHHTLHGHGHDRIQHPRESILVDHELYLLPDRLGKVAHL